MIPPVTSTGPGQFAAALKFAVILNLFVTAFNYAAEPFFFRQAGSDLAAADKTDLRRRYACIRARRRYGVRRHSDLSALDQRLFRPRPAGGAIRAALHLGR